MTDYKQTIREATLEISEDETVEQKAKNLNLIEAIISDEMSVDEILDAITGDTLPEVYKPIEK